MKMQSVIAVAAAGLALSIQPLLAQQTSQQGGQTNTPQEQRRSQSSTADAQTSDSRTFMREAAVGGIAEVEFGRLAQDRAESREVKQFAQRMVTDHSRVNDQLKTLAQNKNVTLPTELDATHKATREKLDSLRGAAFDRAYMDEMRKDHRKDVDAFQKQAQSGSDPDVKAFAAKSLPTLEEHLKLAERLTVSVGTSGSGTKRDESR